MGWRCNGQDGKFCVPKVPERRQGTPRLVADLTTLVLSGLSTRVVVDVGDRPSEQVCARASNARVRACGRVLGVVQSFPRSAKLLWSRGVWLEFIGFTPRTLGRRWWRVSRMCFAVLVASRVHPTHSCRIALAPTCRGFVLQDCGPASRGASPAPAHACTRVGVVATRALACMHPPARDAAAPLVLQLQNHPCFPQHS